MQKTKGKIVCVWRRGVWGGGMWMLGTHTLPSHTHAHIYLHSYGIHAYKVGVSPTKDFHSRIGIFES